MTYRGNWSIFTPHFDGEPLTTSDVTQAVDPQVLPDGANYELSRQTLLGRYGETVPELRTIYPNGYFDPLMPAPFQAPADYAWAPSVQLPEDTIRQDVPSTDEPAPFGLGDVPEEE